MQKIRLFIFIFVFLNICYGDYLSDKIKNFVGENTYRVNRNFIEKIFVNRQDFFQNGIVDSKKVLETLKSNGLLSLKFDSPKEVNIIFSSQTSPIFLLRTVNSVLASMGYSYFEVKKADYDNGFASIIFGFTSEYMIDPLIVLEEMNKRGYIFNDVRKINEQAWEYDVTLFDSRLLNARNIDLGDSLELREVSGEYWLQISDTSGNISIVANSAEWKPKIVFFDKNLHIIDILKKQTSINNITFNVLKDVRFILISDLRSPTILRSGIRVEFSEFSEEN
ncbi:MULTISPECIES: hypothetical protein [unclassified Helicobacter]|uniref:hypothetical protein n=1 Tax=unclassified Helicobacter TaxID=2593540 RepID=UPI000CF141E5|nr:MULTISPECIES: hypothetical protein [unclassified Helicobacter]